MAGSKTSRAAKPAKTETKPAKKAAPKKAAAAAKPAAKAAARPAPETRPAPKAESQPARAGATLQFTGDWELNRVGDIVAGGALTVEYDPARAHARAEGNDSWGVEVYVRFVPGTVIVDAPVVEYAGAIKAVPFTVEVPADAEEVQVWFRNWTRGEAREEIWDSNFGHNYRFEVLS